MTMKRAIVRRRSFSDPGIEDAILSRATRSEATGCLEWSKGRHRDGYGEIAIDGKLWLAHRAIWTAIKGPLPEGVQVLHRCDNPCCIEIDHLFSGTQLDNMADMKAKGRRKNRGIGSGNGRAKLTESQIKDIVLLAGCRSQSEIGYLFGVSQSMVSLIQLGQAWKHAERP